jgi:hypothetical protein
VKVCFAEDTGLLVEANGSLDASGTAEKRITFTGKNATKGYWKGLAFLSTNNANKLLYADITHAGGSSEFCCGFFLGSENIKAAVVVGDYAAGAQVTIKNSTVSDSANTGLFALTNGKLPGFASNTFAANDGVPVALFFEAVAQLDAASVFSGGAKPNGKPYVRVIAPGEKTSKAIEVPKLDLPYGMGTGKDGSIFTVGDALTIAAGTRFEFEANSGILVEKTGTMTVNGSASQRVVFTGRSPTKGYWKGLAFLSTGNVLHNADVQYGGNSDAFCCGFFEPSNAGNTKSNLVVGDYATAAGVTLDGVNSTQSGARGVSALNGSTVTLQGTNDLVTGNATANLGL